MMQMIIYSSIFITSICFLQMNHPLAMGLILLIQTLFICLMTGILTKTFWFSYVLFLIFLGGMLILFIYVTSLASNEMFSLSMKLMISSLSIFFILNFMTIFMDKTLLISFLPNNEMMENTVMNSLIQENTLNLNKLYNFPSNMITLLLINYLLITLIAIVKITNIFYGPLRPMY
uniref:NADH dehydrogenase subunit 6 n=1 Tax=Hybos grossipes TaxID=1446182 RepID=UPI00207A4132|nr:NADH dehydrogenase subunit 6 [Hybos grossipes]URT60159.1 NADH dehydrogenase subunit 6 [Hybos grossipes]